MAIPTKRITFFTYIKITKKRKSQIMNETWIQYALFPLAGFNLIIFPNIFLSFSFRRSEYLGMMTVMRVKFNMVALVFFLCLVFSIIHKGRELKKKGHNLDDCSEEKVVMLRLKYLLELKEERDKFDLAAKANKS